MGRVSVVLCSYNQATYLEHAIKSVLDQTFQDVELIIVDNGSTDSSHDIIKRYADHPKVGAVLLANENIEITKRLNQGLAKARGEFVSLLYSDDYYLPHKLETQVALFESLPADVGIVHSPGYRLNVTTGEQFLDDVLPAQGSCLRQILTNTLYMNPIAPLYRRACFERYPFDEELFVEGEGVMTRMAILFKFHFDADPTVVMRDHPSNIGRAIRRNGELGILSYAKLGRLPEFPDSERDVLLNTVVEHYRRLAWQGIRVVHDRAWARKMALGALAHRKSMIIEPKIAATLAISVAPKICMDALNAVIDRVRKQKSHQNHIEGWRQ
jgi:glycosyltransferase involved in cell wall biosynthesis